MESTTAFWEWWVRTTDSCRRRPCQPNPIFFLQASKTPQICIDLKGCPIGGWGGGQVAPLAPLPPRGDATDQQDPATICMRRIQDLQDTATIVLHKIQDPHDPATNCPGQDPGSIGSLDKINNIRSKFHQDPRSWIMDLGSFSNYTYHGYILKRLDETNTIVLKLLS